MLWHTHMRQKHKKYVRCSSRNNLRFTILIGQRNLLQLHRTLKWPKGRPANTIDISSTHSRDLVLKNCVTLKCVFVALPLNLLLYQIKIPMTTCIKTSTINSSDFNKIKYFFRFMKRICGWFLYSLTEFLTRLN